jgi:TupA-like ATPgrasp
VSFAHRVLFARRLRFLPRRPFAIALHALFQGELSTLRHPVGYAQMAAAKNLGPQNPLVYTTADKYAVRAYVAQRIGREHLIPLIQLVTRPEEIGFEQLRDPCVIKGTHGCDMTILLPAGAPRDLRAIRSTVRRWLATDFGRTGWKEAPYRGLPRRAVVEQFLGDGLTPPSDYKFFMFHGEPGMVVVDQDRFSNHTSTLMTPDWHAFDVENRYAGADALPERPASLEKMTEIARALSVDFEFARIDLYDVDGHVYFGEITHYPGGGLVRLQPREFDRALGALWRDGTPIPEKFIRR